MPRKQLPHVADARMDLRDAQAALRHLRAAYNCADRCPQLKPRIRATLKSAAGAVNHKRAIYQRACAANGLPSFD
jgi:hypothetical protein